MALAPVADVTVGDWVPRTAGDSLFEAVGTSGQWARNAVGHVPTIDATLVDDGRPGDEWWLAKLWTLIADNTKVYRWFLVPLPWCGPGRASLMTGLNPWNHGILLHPDTDLPHALAGDYVTQWGKLVPRGPHEIALDLRGDAERNWGLGVDDDLEAYTGSFPHRLKHNGLVTGMVGKRTNWEGRYRSGIAQYEASAVYPTGNLSLLTHARRIHGNADDSPMWDYFVGIAAAWVPLGTQSDGNATWRRATTDWQINVDGIAAGWQLTGEQLDGWYYALLVATGGAAQGALAFYNYDNDTSKSNAGGPSTDGLGPETAISGVSIEEALASHADAFLDTLEPLDPVCLYYPTTAPHQMLGSNEVASAYNASVCAADGFMHDLDRPIAPIDTIVNVSGTLYEVHCEHGGIECPHGLSVSDRVSLSVNQGTTDVTWDTSAFTRTVVVSAVVDAFTFRFDAGVSLGSFSPSNANRAYCYKGDRGINGCPESVEPTGGEMGACRIRSSSYGGGTVTIVCGTVAAAKAHGVGSTRGGFVVGPFPSLFNPTIDGYTFTRVNDTTLSFPHPTDPGDLTGAHWLETGDATSNRDRFEMMRGLDDTLVAKHAKYAALGRLDDLDWWITSDNGFQTGEFGVRNNKHSVRDASTHVFCIHHSPRRYPAGITYDDDVWIMPDLTLSILDAAHMTDDVWHTKRDGSSMLRDPIADRFVAVQGGTLGTVAAMDNYAGYYAGGTGGAPMVQLQITAGGGDPSNVSDRHDMGVDPEQVSPLAEDAAATTRLNAAKVCGFDPVTGESDCRAA